MSLLIDTALSAGALMVGAFLYGMYQSARANIKLNLQGLDKSHAIQKAANVLAAAWYKSEIENKQQRMAALATDALVGIGYTKKQVEFEIKAIQIDYNARLKGQNSEMVLLVSLVHFVLFHYSHFKPLNLSYTVEANKSDIDSVLAAAKKAEQVYKNDLQ